MRSAGQHMFAHHVARRDDEVDLAVAALLLGELDGGSIDVAHYLDRIDDFAAMAGGQLRSGDDEPFAAIRAINRVLFGELGFRGDQDTYYDPKNSFLDRVMDSRRGIPITLSVLYIEVAARVGAAVHGISFPGHFLVGCERDDETLVLDPYRMGMVMDEDALEALLRQAGGVEAELSPEHLEPATNKQILTRMLTNLAGIYGRRGDLYRAIEVLERMLIVDPGHQRAERELARLRARAEELN